MNIQNLDSESMPYVDYLLQSYSLLHGLFYINRKSRGSWWEIIRDTIVPLVAESFKEHGLCSKLTNDYLLNIDSKYWDKNVNKRSRIDNHELKNEIKNEVAVSTNRRRTES